MKKFNKALNVDITELKSLYIKKDKTEFRKLKAEIMQKHKISKATVYREMKKDIPGTYKNPNYNPPARMVTAEEMELVRGMLYRQKTIEQIRAEMESNMGKPYSWDRIDRIRGKIEEEQKILQEVNKNGKDNPVIINSGTSNPAGRKISLPGKGSTQFEYESPHGIDMKEFLMRALSVDKMDPNTFITVPAGSYNVKLGYDAVKDIQRIIANSAAGKAYDVIEIAQINTKHLCSEQIRHFVNGRSHSIKELRELKSILDEYESQQSSMLDFEFIVDIVKYFAGEDVDREQIVLETDYLARQREGISEKLLPDPKEVRRGIFHEMEKNR